MTNACIAKDKSKTGKHTPLIIEVTESHGHNLDRKMILCRITQ